MTEEKIVVGLFKTRVTSIKELTIPQLQLQSALLLAQLLVCVAKILKVKDPSITLNWIKRFVDRNEIFIRNQALKIVSLLDSSHWFHIRSEINSADIAG